MAILLIVAAMDERDKLAFEFARDTTTQLLTLATGVVALTITFAKDFVGGVSPCLKVLAVGCWVSFLISVLFGLLTLMALTGTLEPAGGKHPVSIRGPNVTRPAGLQIAAFFLGLMLAVAFGLAAGLSSPNKALEPAAAERSPQSQTHAVGGGSMPDR